MTTFVLVGFGFRAAAIHRVAGHLPGLTCVGAVVREPRPLPVPVYRDLAECLREVRPDFVVSAVAKAAGPAVIAEAVAHGVPVLAETPPAADRAGLRALWAAPGGDLVQIAEQYLLMPSHAARLAAVRGGIIGTPTQVQVSSTQQYHAISLIRGFLDAGPNPAADRTAGDRTAAGRTTPDQAAPHQTAPERPTPDNHPVIVRAARTVAPLVSPLDRGGWTDDPTPRPATTTVATLDFGDGRSGIYDFTDGQTRNLLRFRRLLVRGTHGELHDDEIVHMPAARTVARTPLVRRQSGHDLDLGGFDTESITLGSEVLYRNPYAGCRFNDDEIAIATLLDAMAAWVRGEGPPPYPLAEGIRDQLLALAVEEAADTDRTITVADPATP